MRGTVVGAGLALVVGGLAPVVAGGYSGGLALRPLHPAREAGVRPVVAAQVGVLSLGAGAVSLGRHDRVGLPGTGLWLGMRGAPARLASLEPASAGAAPQ